MMRWRTVVQTFAVVLVMAAAAAAQIDVGEATKNQGSFLTAIPFASVRYCLSTATGTPCTPTATLYASETLSSALPAGTTATADANGNFHAYLAPGLYLRQVTDPVTGITYSDKISIASGTADYGFHFKVTAFGALGDGSNDTSAFNSAIAAAQTFGGCVWVPPGTYSVNLTHSSATYSLCIEGVPERSILTPYADGSAAIKVDASSNSVQPIYLKGLYIKGHTGFTNSRGILFTGGYTGSTYVQSDFHHLDQVVIDGTTSKLFTSCVEVQGRQLWSVYEDVRCKYTSFHGFAITESNTAQYDGAFNKNTFDRVSILETQGRGFSIDYTRTSNGELVAQSNVFQNGTIQGTCRNTAIADCAGFYGKNTEAIDTSTDHFEDNGTLSADSKGAHVRLTGTYAQGFRVASNEIIQGQYGTYVDATLAFGVIGGGNRVTVSTKPIYVATSHAQSAVTILDDPKSAGAATIVADVNGDTHVFQPLLGAQPFYNQKSSTTDESVAGLTFINLTNSSGRTLTTLSGGVPNQTVTLYQAGSGTTTLTHGTSTNNLNLQPCAVNSLLTTGQSIVLQFNGTNWHIVGAPINVLCPTTVDVSGATRFGPTTVGSLPSAASADGSMFRVTDSTAITAEGQTCVGGGANKAFAFSNGSVWKCF